MANNGAAGLARDRLDAASKVAFAAALGKAKVDEVHIFACSTGAGQAGWDFTKMLSQDLTAWVSAPTTSLQVRMDGTPGLWILDGGRFHAAHVPTLSQWGLIAFCLLLLAVMYRASRQRTLPVHSD